MTKTTPSIVTDVSAMFVDTTTCRDTKHFEGGGGQREGRREGERERGRGEEPKRRGEQRVADSWGCIC